MLINSLELPLLIGFKAKATVFIEEKKMYVLLFLCLLKLNMTNIILDLVYHFKY